MELEKILEIEIKNNKTTGRVELFRNKNENKEGKSNYIIRLVTKDMWYFAPFYSNETDIKKLKEQIANYAQNLI